MRTATLTYDDIPPSSNTNTGVGGRGHPRAVAVTKRKWEGIFAMVLLAGRVPRDLSLVRVTPKLQFRTRARRDSDNFYFAISKPLGDALVKGGWLPDDTPDHYQCQHVQIELGCTHLVGLGRGRMSLLLEYE